MNYYLLLALILFVYMNFWYLISLIKKRNDIADIAWGLGFILLSWSSAFLSQNFGYRSILANLLVTIWGLRLTLHIYQRNHKKTEDYRYLSFKYPYFQVYILQGILLYLTVFPVLFINKNSIYFFGILDVLGLIIWIIGFYFEAVGDAQLKKFVQNPKNKGKIIQSGLWRYSRHPNYFGEVTQWWGIFLFALSIPTGFQTIIGPITITVLLLFVSGIPLLEKKYANNSEFQIYKSKTSKFFPLPPKRK